MFVFQQNVTQQAQHMLRLMLVLLLVYAGVSSSAGFL